MTLHQRFSPKSVTAFHTGTKWKGAFQTSSWQVLYIVCTTLFSPRRPQRPWKYRGRHTHNEVSQ